MTAFIVMTYHLFVSYHYIVSTENKKEKNVILEKTVDKEMPIFKVSTFWGDTLDGDVNEYTRYYLLLCLL